MTAPLSGTLSYVVSTYFDSLNSFSGQFQAWGQWLFFGLFTINFMWSLLWLAFERGEFDQVLAQFLRRLFITLFFYTLMLNHQWLMSILDSVQVMGRTLTHAPCDPSSIISDGISLANILLLPLRSISLFSITFGTLVVLIIYVAIVYMFIKIALDLAETLIETAALITVSSFFLAFSALSATSKIAKNVVEAVIANCAKLLGLYLVIGTGMNIILNIARLLPPVEDSLDDYWWLLAAVSINVSAKSSAILINM